VILVDANLLIYAVNLDLPQHKQAKAWWEDVLSGSAIIGIPLVSLLAFLRICTNPRVFSQPLTPESAIAYMDEWLDCPGVRLVVPGAGIGPLCGTC
jgi:toxin-antitoxin system PIN domain toxin